jgi:phospholipid/cholesterol/gamma-HCH transport system substrate-binding protein
MEKNKRNLAALGILTIVAAIVGYVGFYYLVGNPVFKGGMDVVVALRNGAGLKRGDRVIYQGVEVGSVKAVGFGTGNRVIVTLRLNNRIEMPADTRARVSGDVFGAHSIDLVPGDAVVKLEPGDTITGMQDRALTELAGDIGTQVSGALTRVDSLLSVQTVRDLRATAAILPSSAAEMRGAMSEFRNAAAAFRRTAEEIETAKTGDAARTLFVRLDSTASRLNNAARALERIATSVEGSAGTFASVMQKIDRGEGSLGRLVNDTSLYAEVHGLARELRTLAADVKARPSRYINLKIF